MLGTRPEGSATVTAELPDETGGRPRATKLPLDRARIIAAGLDLAASPESSTVSVRELGAKLGTDPTAIYRHFPSKVHLMQALLDEIVSRSVASVTANREDWKQRLRQLAANTVVQFEAHPAVAVEAITLTTNGPGERDAIELMLDAFSQAGLPDEELVHHYALFASHVLSSAAGIARARGEQARQPEASGRWFEGPLLANPRQHPHIARLAIQLSELEDRELFDLGVEAVIESAERIVASR